MLRNQRLLEDWKEENTWYDAEDDMSMYADRIFDRYRDAKGQLLEPLEDILEEIGEKVKRKFSDYFQPSPSKGKSRVADVAGNTTITPPPQKVTWSQLTPQQREICERSVRNREFATRQDWINARFDLKK
jgi:gas vesicle protein